MPALKPTDHYGEIVWLGYVSDRDKSLRSDVQTTYHLGFGGMSGESHAGLTRLSCSRVTSQYPRGTEIRNVRQLSIVSAEELAQIADDMQLPNLEPAWLGASMVIRGIPDFTHIPPSSRLQTQTGTTVVVDMENRPCHLPAKVIDEDAPGFGKSFKTAAKDRRGVTAWVEREGAISVGDTVRLHVPDQRVWQP
ncbi:MOSC domain-containing protein [Pseudaestuariivita rosea]|uniref:MOSC domain-containing protein n=1 Tax=Pseudaestuariivita rosea TaxID=2763263 RepID=UPI001ABA2788|nr:MOSC domain-containing protein [Pseudaestuariivita rosea]